MTCRAATSAATCAGASPTGAQLAYDTQGQLAAWQNAPSSPTSTATFLYDGEGNRVQQVATTSGTTTTTSSIGRLEEVTSDGATTTTTAYYGSLALSVNGALSYTLSDGLGSVSESVSASSGVVSATQLYAPYGAVRYQSGALPTSHGYTGQRADAVSGLDYYSARYYDPVAGQFASADTTLAGGLNRYAYVAGNPETTTDPSGHCPWCIAGAIIGAVVGAGIAYGTQVYNNYQSGANDPWTHNIDISSIVSGAVTGAMIGLIAGATFGVGLAAAGGVMALEGGTVGAAAVAGGTAAFNFLVNGVVPETEGDAQLESEVGATAHAKPSGATSPAIPTATTANQPTSSITPPGTASGSSVWNNEDDQLTNGTYTISEAKMQKHLPYTEASRGLDPNNGLPESVFLSGVDAHKTVLDAALYADDNLLWNPATNKADVPVANGPIGVEGKTGELVNGITVSRTNTGFVHGWPNNLP